MLNFILLVHVFHARTFYSLSTTARRPYLSPTETPYVLCWELIIAWLGLERDWGCSYTASAVSEYLSFTTSKVCGLTCFSPATESARDSWSPSILLECTSGLDFDDPTSTDGDEIWMESTFTTESMVCNCILLVVKHVFTRTFYHCRHYYIMIRVCSILPMPLLLDMYSSVHSPY